ncbi:ATP-binding protein [Quadrisphaera sp. DSM 44207]|uniref:ATP-binding protein n=1 Tax=Quadrisphaera sp. DSM 44207 TaxID=1881057 RepID=UPI0015A3A603|nr:ATP-binding protein [Quadrisphaera sp. DSM 44207]
MLNPYTPGAGQPPAFLIGRARELSDFQARLQRLENGRGAQCTLIVGLRGVGKTVLLNEFARAALTRQWVVVEYELTAGSNVIETVSRLVREALLEIAPPSRWSAAAKKVSRILGGMEAT